MKKNVANREKLIKLIQKTGHEKSDEVVQIFLSFYPKMKSLTLKNLLDIVFSIYIRIKKSDKKGNCICITCLTKLFWREIQNGHFNSRGNLKHRYSEQNCRPQCYICNVIKSGNYVWYSAFMTKILGSFENALELFKDKEIVKIYSYDYVDLIYKFFTLAQKEAEKRGLTI